MFRWDASAATLYVYHTDASTGLYLQKDKIVQTYAANSNWISAAGYGARYYLGDSAGVTNFQVKALDATTVFSVGSTGIGFFTTSLYSPEVHANTLVDVGDGSTTVTDAAQIELNPLWFSVTDDGTSEAYVTFSGASGTVLTTESIEAKFLIHEETLTTNDRFRFAIPSGYDYIVIKGLLRGDVSDTIDHIDIEFNDDNTASNYYRASHYYGDSHGNGEVSDNYIGSMAGDTATSGSFTSIDIVIMDPDNTDAFAQARSRTAERQASNILFGRDQVVEWETLDAVTTVTIAPDGYSTQKFKFQSKIWVYGVKSTPIVADLAVSILIDDDGTSGAEKISFNPSHLFVTKTAGQLTAATSRTVTNSVNGSNNTLQADMALPLPANTMAAKVVIDSIIMETVDVSGADEYYHWDLVDSISNTVLVSKSSVTTNDAEMLSADFVVPDGAALGISIYVTDTDAVGEFVCEGITVRFHTEEN
jgi:hypothetical protein